MTWVGVVVDRVRGCVKHLGTYDTQRTATLAVVGRTFELVKQLGDGELLEPLRKDCAELLEENLEDTEVVDACLNDVDEALVAYFGSRDLVAFAPGVYECEEVRGKGRDARFRRQLGVPEPKKPRRESASSDESEESEESGA